MPQQTFWELNRPKVVIRLLFLVPLLFACCHHEVPSPPPKIETVREGTQPGESLSLPGDSATYRWCPPGKFLMGDVAALAKGDDGSAVEVTITHGFWITETEVTQNQWFRLTGERHWRDIGFDDHPANACHSGDDNSAEAFCQKLTARERELNRLPDGWVYRLPTEAEWEYACRAGSTAYYGFGDDVTKLGEYAWYDQNSLLDGGYMESRVAEKRPNNWGLKDMHGNVLEWCADVYQPHLPGGQDPFVSTGGSERVCRGGACDDTAVRCQSHFRYKRDASTFDWRVGFRYVIARPLE